MKDGYENFLKETEDSIKETGHTIKDVMFIGTSDGNLRMTWSEFEENADFDYDSGYGTQVIPNNLIVYFIDNTYMFRYEYDGSEWWEYRVNKLFKQDDNYLKAKLTFIQDGWYESLKIKEN